MSHKERQLTVRGFEPDLEHALLSAARADGLSLNQAAVKLMRKGAGLGAAGGRSGPTIGDGLDPFLGGWTDRDEAAVLEAVASLDAVEDAPVPARPRRTPPRPRRRP